MSNTITTTYLLDNNSLLVIKKQFYSDSNVTVKINHDGFTFKSNSQLFWKTDLEVLKA